MYNYHINIFYSHEDGGYIADIPDLENCSAFGETPEEALAEVLIAKRLWLSVAEEDGHAVQEARYKPFIYKAG
jgi:predicted RNase H-like HicB family nuclease